MRCEAADQCIFRLPRVLSRRSFFPESIREVLVTKQFSFRTSLFIVPAVPLRIL
jgi:hypothetical protein